MAMKQGGDQCACTVRVGEKGQIVIPKEARDMFGIKPGDTLLLLADRQRGIAIPPKSEFEKMTGLLYAAGFNDGEKEDGDS